MKKILFPTDFSDCAGNAYAYAISLAKALGATMDVLNVFNLPLVDVTNVPPDFIEQMLAQKKAEAMEKLDTFANQFENPYLGEKLAVYGLFIPEEITDLVQQRGYDLVVMGTRGEDHTALEKLVGSVTTQTMMRAGCPVIAVPGHARWAGIRHIAFATDFQPNDLHAAGSLMALSEKLNAGVHFVHVETKIGLDIMEDYIAMADYPYKFLDFTVVSSNSVMDGLEQFVKDRQIDLLALFIPERRLWERLFHSSFSKKMAFHTNVPLLVFHE